MRIRIAVIKNEEEWTAFGDNGKSDTESIKFIQENFDIDGEVHFVEADLPERLLHVQAEVVQ